MPDTDPGYAEALDALSRGIREARFSLQRRANAEVIALYWRIGRAALERRARGEGQGDAQRLLDELRGRFPVLHDITPDELAAMQAFAAVWPERAGIVQQPVGQLPWPHVVVLLTALDDQRLREWYAAKAVERTWGRRELAERIAARAHDADPDEPGGFAAALRRLDSDLAREIMADPRTASFWEVDAGDPPPPHE